MAGCRSSPASTRLRRTTSCDQSSRSCIGTLVTRLASRCRGLAEVPDADEAVRPDGKECRPDIRPVDQRYVKIATEPANLNASIRRSVGDRTVNPRLNKPHSRVVRNLLGDPRNERRRVLDSPAQTSRRAFNACSTISAGLG